MEPELVRGVAGWLLTGIGGVDDVVRHPAAQALDACGQAWHVFDLDPTVTTLRHRALPVDEELPEPRRRSEDSGAPGHSGRKRGDIVHRRVTVQHAGSGMWVHAHLSPGNGEGVVDFERALDSIVKTCERLGHSVSRALVRMDGEFGNVPWYAACRERGLPFVTRLNRAKLYEDPRILEQLRKATWVRVPDSMSGPHRSAADVGVLTIQPGERTRRPDGTPYEPVTVRVVASIIPHTGQAKRGRTLDGYQVELFAVDVSADVWPAPEAIAAYYGRAAEENRFAQEDRELGLDRIISYHLPGQELAALAGLSLRNLRIARGFAQDPPPARRPAQALRHAPIDDTVPKHWPRDPVLKSLLDGLDWPAMLASRAGWQWNPQIGMLLCPDGRPLELTTIRSAEHATGRTNVIFRRPTGGCEDCEPRASCLTSTSPGASKHAEFSIPTGVAKQLRDRLSLVRRPSAGALGLAPVEGAPGPHAVSDALFLPARAREAFARLFRGATLYIEVEEAERPPLPKLVAVDQADRQRRRKTWEQSVDRHALPEGSRVHVAVAGAATLRSLLGESARSTSDKATAA